jgi:hypothetical protein
MQSAGVLKIGQPLTTSCHENVIFVVELIGGAVVSKTHCEPLPSIHTHMQVGLPAEQIANRCLTCAQTCRCGCPKIEALDKASAAAAAAAQAAAEKKAAEETAATATAAARATEQRRLEAAAVIAKEKAATEEVAAELEEKMNEPVQNWDEETVSAWVEEREFHIDLTCLAMAGVDGSLLIELTDAMLAEDLQMESKLQRKKVLIEIKKLTSKNRGVAKKRGGPAKGAHWGDSEAAEKGQRVAIDRLFDLMDVNHDNSVTKFEFLDFLKENKPLYGPFSTVSKLQTTFGLNDKTAITREDFHMVFSKCQKEGLTIDLFTIATAGIGEEATLGDDFVELNTNYFNHSKQFPEVVLSYQSHSISEGKGKLLMWALSNGLTDHSIDCFNGYMVTGGDNWQDEWFGLLPESKCVVAMLSKSYFRSGACIEEILAACRLRKPVIPIYVEPVDISGRFLGENYDQVKQANFLRPFLSGNCIPPPDQGMFQGEHSDDFNKNLATLAAVIKEKHLN